MTRGRLVVHAHFYQPSRIDPFTGEIPRDPSAAPSHDWTERVTAECYRPNAERGALWRVSWDLGPTLTADLATRAPDVLAGFVAADRRGRSEAGGPAIAQAFHHAILPLAAMRDRYTEVVWGVRDFEHRFGRRPTAMWLPETAVDLPTLRILADAGIAATILAPWQAETSHVDARHPYRVDLGGGRHIVVAFYDGDLSGTVSFEPDTTADADRFARERVAPRLAVPLPGGGAPMLVIASDGELYGHHRPFRDLFLQRLVAPSQGASTAASTWSISRRRSPSGRVIRTRRSGSANARRGAAITASCAGRPSAPTCPTGAGSRRCGVRSTDWPAASIP